MVCLVAPVTNDSDVQDFQKLGSVSGRKEWWTQGVDARGCGSQGQKVGLDTAIKPLTRPFTAGELSSPRFFEDARMRRRRRKPFVEPSISRFSVEGSDSPPIHGRYVSVSTPKLTRSCYRRQRSNGPGSRVVGSNGPDAPGWVDSARAAGGK